MDYKKLVIATTSMGSFLSVVNGTSLLISIPTIMISLHTTFFFVIWVLIMYPMVMTIAAPIFGRYSDFIGRKKLYGYGYVFFFVGSLLSALSFNVQFLLFARVIQGIGGALLFSNSLAIIADAFDVIEMKTAIGVNAMIIGIATAIGPLIGGILTVINWRYVFVFNVPLALIGFGLSTKLVDIKPRKTSFEIRTPVLFSIFITLFVIYMTIAPSNGWFSPVDATIIIFSMLFLFLFAMVSLRTRNPVIDVSIFRNRDFATQGISTMLSSITRYSSVLIMIIFLQGPMGLSPLISSIYVIPYAAALGSYISGKIRARGSEGRMIYLGLALSFAGSLALFLDRSVNPLFFSGIAVIGLGVGLFYTPNNAILMRSLSPDMRGIAAGMRTVLLNMGSVIGMAMVFSIVAVYVPQNVLSYAFLGVNSSIISNFKSGMVTGVDISFLISGTASLLAIFLIMFAFHHNKKSN
ncbi:MAG: MFS transporter [Thermoplasmata archaeon]